MHSVPGAATAVISTMAGRRTSATMAESEVPRRRLMQFRAMRSIAAAVAMLAGAVHADILIGQTVGVTGAVAATVKESMQGAQLYIDRVNAQGGIKGEKVAILTLDDGFDVKRAVENTRVLVEEKNVLAMFMNRGTPHTEAMLPVLEKN